MNTRKDVSMETTVRVRLSRREKTLLTAMADEAGVGVSAFIRQKLFGSDHFFTHHDNARWVTCFRDGEVEFDFQAERPAELYQSYFDRYKDEMQENVQT